MKYTFKNADGKEKTVNIDESILAQGKREGLTMRETIERFLSDEGYMVDPTVQALTDKAKAAGINNAGKVSGGKRKAPTRKPDETKRALIRLLERAIAQDDEHEVRDIQITNIERIIAFSIGDDKYELTLSKKRKPKV